MAAWQSGSGTPAGIDLCVTALHRRGVMGTVAVVNAFRAAYPDYERSDSLVKAMLNGSREPRPDFVHRLARLAGIPVRQVFALLGWLPPEEAADPSVPDLLRQLHGGITAVGRLARDIEEPGFDRAPAAAAAAVIASRHGASRFTVSLSSVDSGSRYRVPIMDVAEFHLRAGVKPLPQYRDIALTDGGPLAETLAAARQAEADGDSDYWTIRLELSALTRRTLRHRGEYSWQGQPGNGVWLSAEDGHRPRHLLVQDRIAGLRRDAAPAMAARLSARGVVPIVVIGHRPLAGGAAALLAEALGLRYILPRAGEEILDNGLFMPVLRTPVRGRVEAWLSVVEHLRDRAAGGESWPAVVLTRPYVFADVDHYGGHALRELLRLPAHVVCVRPADAMLRWWAARRARTDPAAGFDATAWVERERRVYDRLENALGERPVARTLLVRIPEPDEPLPVTGWGWPDVVTDLQPRLAWAVLDWLDRTANRRGAKLSGLLGQGLLAEWAPTLAEDPGVSALLTR